MNMTDGNAQPKKSHMSAKLKQAFTKTKKKPKDKTPKHKYFTAHQCYIPAEKVNAHQIKCSLLRKCCLYLTSVNMRDIRAANLYRSYSSLCAEKYRQYKYYPLSIHPFSILRVWLEVIVAISLMASTIELVLIVTDPHRYFVKDKVGAFIMYTFFMNEFVYLLNMILNFFTGYVEGNTYQYVVLSLRKIALHYVRSWLILDFVSAISFISLITPFLPDDSLFSAEWNYILELLKLLRIPILLRYLNNMLIVWRIGIFGKTVIEISVLIITYILWNMYLQFTVEFARGIFSSQVNCSWITMAKLWHVENSLRFTYTFDRAVGMLRNNANINMVEKSGCFENFFVVAWIIAKLLIYHCSFKYVVYLFGNESAKDKYFIMANQVSIFLNERKFPPRIKEKILKFYAIRFQSNFFAETKMLNCVTGQLREDILMHTGRQLVEQLDLLKNLPRSLLLDIGLKLKMVVFIAGDIIFKINTVGDCLYFIDKGTVAIYSESGREICHVEDGDYFGEIALVMKHIVRTASAVAVTNCELFRLDKEDFNSSIACYSTVYENIKKVAINRYERTCLLDEHHKAELKMAEDHYFKQFKNTSVENDIGSEDSYS